MSRLMTRQSFIGLCPQCGKAVLVAPHETTDGRTPMYFEVQPREALFHNAATQLWELQSAHPEHRCDAHREPEPADVIPSRET